MILMQSKRDRMQAVFVCDVCKQVIEDAGKGAVVFRSQGLGEEELYHPIHVHKGRCHDQAEATFAKGSSAPWHELMDHLNDVACGAGLTFKDMLLKEVSWCMSALTPQQYGAICEKIDELADRLRDSGISSRLWDGA